MSPLLIVLFFRVFSKEWKLYFFISLTISVLTLIGTIIFADESPRLLMSKGQLYQAQGSLNNVSKMNGSMQVSIDDFARHEEEAETLSKKEQLRKAIRDPETRRKLIVFTI